jgi:deazaflavin-dependent oxidoreductase (nitroreductase family)
MQIRLTTAGSRSGQPREVRLYGWEDGDRIVVVGSRGGAAGDPAWAGNLRAEPRARLVIGGDERSVVAREVSDDAERRRLWDLVTDAFPLYATYQRRTSRQIPLFVLEPAEDSATAERR